MEIKKFELRDYMTFIPIIAIKISGADGWLARRAGYESSCILMGRLEGSAFHYDPYQWRDRTFQTAHHALIAKWDTLKDGDLIDVSFELGETKTPCESEEHISNILDDHMQKVIKSLA